MSATFTLGSPLRAAIGLMLLGAAAGVLMVSRTIDWGVAWTAVIPALALLVPGWALLQRRSLTWTGDQTLTVTHGWFWRRALVLNTAAAELELLPTAGLMAVVLHRAGRAHPLATFVLPATAQRLATWLDDHHPAKAFIRREAPRPQGDR